MDLLLAGRWMTRGRRTFPAALAVLAAGLLLPASAGALPMQADPGDVDYSRCFDRTTVERTSVTNPILHDAVDGNFRARRLQFDLNLGKTGCAFDPEFGEEIAIRGISVIVKTPYQIDTEPDIDDIDSDADGVALVTALAGDWPDFTHWVYSGVVDPTDTGPDGNFTDVEICVDYEIASIADCMADSPVFMTDLGNGYMIFTLGFESPIYIYPGEVETFYVVTLAHSDFFNAPAMGQLVTVPEIVMGFRFVELVVPEPGLALLLLPALGGLLAIRRPRA